MQKQIYGQTDKVLPNLKGYIDKVERTDSNSELIKVTGLDLKQFQLTEKSWRLGDINWYELNFVRY